MTRWARNKSAQKHGKLPSEPTLWEDLKAPVDPTNKKKLLKAFGGGAVKTRKPLNSFTITHIDIKNDKNKSGKLSENLNETQGNSRRKNKINHVTKKLNVEKLKKEQTSVKHGSVPTDEENALRLKKKEKFRDEMIKRRNERGIQLLSPKIERKIYNIKKSMRKKGISGDKIKEEIRKLRRKEELHLRKDSNRLCLRCRKPGHKVADCHEITGDHEQSMGICFKCGSTEHKLSQCTVPSSKSGGLPFAKCFVCGGLGHLSGSCPKNPRGKYPKGGSCKICGSVNHFANDCPQDKKLGEIEEPAVSVIVPGMSVDLDDYIQENQNFNLKPKKKAISF